MSNTNVCPVKCNKCIPSGFVLASVLQHLFWVPSVIPCYAILSPSSYITNDSRQHTCVAVTQIPCVLSDDSEMCTSVLHSVQLTHHCNSMRSEKPATYSTSIILGVVAVHGKFPECLSFQPAMLCIGGHEHKPVPHNLYVI